MPATHILVVEDDPLSLEMLVENLRFEGYETTGASCGAEAWRALSEHPDKFDVILLDRLMPDMDGIEILRRLKAQAVPSHASVIMQTSLASDEDVVAGLRAGAYYYLTKPFTAQALFAIVAAAARDRHGLRKLQVDVQQASRALSQLLTAQFTFQTPAQVGDLATVISKATPCPERSVGGLVELMLNAVEHGNLGISYAEKSELLLQGDWPEEITRRLALPEHAHKQATLRFERRKQDIRFTICDEGAGFDWRGFLELSPERAFHLHGRGIAMCKKMWFDQITYLGNGNEVLAVLRT